MNIQTSFNTYTKISVLGLFASVIAVAASLFFCVSVSRAQSAANTLKVSPVRTDIKIAPGESKIVQVFVSNITEEPITVRPIRNDFVTSDDRGTPALILNENAFAPTHSLKRFMAPIENITIQPGKTQTIDVRIDVPANAQAGGYFGAVRLVPATPGQDSQVNMSASVASLILLTVPGDIVEKLNTTDISVQQNSTFGSKYFWTPENIQLSLRLENTGNVQTAPFGKISVSSGDEVVYEADFNNKNPKDMILPDSARRWEVSLKNLDKFGRYTVNTTLTYGENNKTIHLENTFWVVPKQYAIWLGVGIGVLIIVFIMISIALGRRKKRRSKVQFRRKR